MIKALCFKSLLKSLIDLGHKPAAYVDARDKDKIGKFFRVFNSSNSDQVRKVIGDETVEQKWVWLEEE